MKTPLVLAAALAAALASAEASGLDLPKNVSDETAACLECHRQYTPGIVYDWAQSRHAWTKPEAAFDKPAITRRISAPKPPEAFRGKVVGCFECHGQKTGTHADTFDHMGFSIHVVVTPKDCETCHPVEVSQYAQGKKANAYDNLAQNALFSQLVDTVAGGWEWKDPHLVAVRSTPESRWETCYGCHGTVVTVRGMTKVQTAMGEIEVPDLANWPNQGVGRVNPDGSKGACTSCHARHGFSIEDARHPHTCSQCHLEPDSPAWNVYRDSKHGNLYEVREAEFDWENVPWVIGRDFTVPTCAACHMSLVVDDKNTVLGQRSHDFGARLWVRIFGLPYTHPQPLSGATHTLRNTDSQPLPTTFDGAPAAQGLLSPEDQASRKVAMTKVCNGCHNRQWIEGHFRRFDVTVKETDTLVRTATALMREGWKRGVADPKNPFDEPLEHLWLETWLFYANSIRYASAMTGAPDYATFKNGWWNLNNTLKKMEAAVTREAEKR
ncbi:MAG: hydroxylamine oxidase [Deltaproteobacteria bacterium]|nr:hydroxylamine oxidase [Deltaproteobacteria bacterium]